MAGGTVTFNRVQVDVIAPDHFCSAWNRVRLSPGKTMALFTRKLKDFGFLTLLQCVNPFPHSWMFTKM